MRIMQRNCQCLFSGHWEQIMKRENVDVELTSFQSGTRLVQVLDCQSLGGQVQVRNTSLKSSSWFPRHSWLLETLIWWQLLAMVLSPSGKRSSFDAAAKMPSITCNLTEQPQQLCYLPHATEFYSVKKTIHGSITQNIYNNTLA